MGMIIIRVPAQSICPSSDSGWLKVLLEVTDVDAQPHDGIPNLGILRSTLNVSRTILRSSITVSSYAGWLKVLLEVTDVDARPHDGIPNLGILRSTLNVSRTILRSTITVSSYAGGLKITPFPWIITFTVHEQHRNFNRRKST